MTQFGKILVFLNVALSVGMAAWALGIFTDRVDWANQKASKEQPTEIKIREAKIATLKEARGWAELRWQDSLNKLTGLEATRRRNTDWYAKQLQEVQTGQGTVKNLRYDAGSLVLDNAALPALVDLLNAAGQPLQSMSVQQDQWKTTQDSLKATLDENDKYLKEQARLTNEIDGAKGVRQQIYREQAKQALIAQEQKDLQPLKINAQVDSQLLIKRQVQLESRVLELKSAASASAK